MSTKFVCLLTYFEHSAIEFSHVKTPKLCKIDNIICGCDLNFFAERNSDNKSFLTNTKTIDRKNGISRN